MSEVMGLNINSYIDENVMRGRENRRWPAGDNRRPSGALPGESARRFAVTPARRRRPCSGGGEGEGVSA